MPRGSPGIAEGYFFTYRSRVAIPGQIAKLSKQDPHDWRKVPGPSLTATGYGLTSNVAGHGILDKDIRVNSKTTVEWLHLISIHNIDFPAGRNYFLEKEIIKSLVHSIGVGLVGAANPNEALRVIPRFPWAAMPPAEIKHVPFFPIQFSPGTGKPEQCAVCQHGVIFKNKDALVLTVSGQTDSIEMRHLATACAGEIAFIPAALGFFKIHARIQRCGEIAKASLYPGKTLIVAYACGLQPCDHIFPLVGPIIEVDNKNTIEAFIKHRF
jgi:hypothetical protein